MQGYGAEYLLGRLASAWLDIASIILVYILGKRWRNWQIGLTASALYALAPLSIQYAHFMVMESWLTLTWLLVVLVLTKWADAPSWRLSALLGGLIGLAMAVKISSVILVPLAAVVMAAWIYFDKFTHRSVLGHILVGLITVPLSFRLFQPTIFTSPSWLNWSWRTDFQAALNFQKQAISGAVMFPPQWQWVGTWRWWHPLKNLMFYGLGPVFGIFMLTGFPYLIHQSIKRRQIVIGATTVFAVGYFIWQGSQFVKLMRYFNQLIPIYAFAAANFIVLLTRKMPKTISTMVIVLICAAAAIWAVMFTSVYRRPQTRVLASQWIYANIPRGDTLAFEEWDDPLPLPMANQDINQFQTFQMAVYAPEDELKRAQIRQWVKDADWMILSSWRAKGSIGRLPEQFPLMAKFYQDLESGTLGFVKAAEFSSFPSLNLGAIQITIDDSRAEEAFWVYDHPRVEIYRKVAAGEGGL